MSLQTHTCTTCFKSFSRRGDLTRHSNIHTGLRPHKCSDCGKAFSQFSGLKTHRNIHTRAKPFTCEIDGCKAAFGDPSSRARHCKEKHRTIGAYRCPIDHCKSSIKRRSAFVKHLKKHSINPDNIDMDALAPIMISRLAPYQKQSSKAAPTGGSHHSTPLKPDLPDVLCPDVAFYQKGNGLVEPVPRLPNMYGTSPAFSSNWPRPGVLPHAGIFGHPTSSTPALPTERLLTFDSPSPSNSAHYRLDSPISNPGLSHSASPSPPPYHHFLHPGHGTRLYGPISMPSTPPTSSQYHSSLLCFPDSPYAAQLDGQKPTSNLWESFEVSMLGKSHEQYHDIQAS